MKRALFAGVVLVVLGGLVAVGIYCWRDYRDDMETIRHVEQTLKIEQAMLSWTERQATDATEERGQGLFEGMHSRSMRLDDIRRRRRELVPLRIELALLEPTWVGQARLDLANRQIEELDQRYQQLFDDVRENRK